MENDSANQESFAPARKSLREKSAMLISNSSLTNGVIILDRNNQITDRLESKRDGLAGKAILHDLVSVGLPVKGNQKFTEKDTSPINNYLGNFPIYSLIDIDYSLLVA